MSDRSSPPPPPPPDDDPPALFTTADQSDLLASARVESLLGSGSNGVVLSASFPSIRGANGRPKIAALKIMSHFWDRAAVQLLDCERESLLHLPRHPNVIALDAEFPATIPPALHEFLTADMKSGARADPAHQTQVFVMEYHPVTLEAYRARFPLPLPWPVLWRLSRDLVAAVVHLQRHGVLHLDLKADNVLVAHDGRAVLADFGISRVFRSPAVVADGGPDVSASAAAALSLPYSEPFPVLMNRLVLAPEVLLAHDAAKGLWRAGGEVAGGLIPFAQQGIWSVGVVLYELACWFGHEPSYPEPGGGVHAGTYSLVGLPPLPCCDLSVPEVGIHDLASTAISHDITRAEEGAAETDATAGAAAADGAPGAAAASCELPSQGSSGFLRAPCGAFLYVTGPLRGFPVEFCALVLSMLDANPASRITASDALLALNALAPTYSCSLRECGSATIGEVPIASAPLVLPDGCVVVGAPRSEARTESDPESVPVLLRHCSGACRLISSCAPSETVGAALARWDDGEEVVISVSRFDVPTARARCAVSIDSLGLADACVLLGGAVVSRGMSLSELLDLVGSPALTDVDVSPTSIAPARSPSNSRALVLDLVPPPPRSLSKSVESILLGLHDITVYADTLPVDPHGVQVDTASQLFPSPLPRVMASEAIDPSKRCEVVLKWLRTYGSVAERSHESDIGVLGVDVLPTAIDMREALLYRSCLALTALSNAALREDASIFPFVPCAKVAVEAARRCGSNHEALAAAVGLLRNVSCTDDVACATSMMELGALDAVLDVALSAWPMPVSSAPAGPQPQQQLHESLETPTPPAVVTASVQSLCPAQPPAGNEPAALAGLTPGSPSLRPLRLHSADPRFAEDALLTISNLLRFDSHQHVGVPFARCVSLATATLRLFRRNLGVHESAAKMLRYVCAIPGEGVAEAILANGALAALCATLEGFPGHTDVVCDALHVACSVLVFDACRRADVCPYERLAAGVVGVMAHAEHADSATVQALGATVLRNLACVVVDGVAGSGGASSAALAVAHAGAPAVLEAAMERLPHAPAVQENGRCALYNLLLIGTGDVRAALKRLAELEIEVAGLRLASLPTKQPLEGSPRASISHRTSFTRRGSFSPTTVPATGPRTPRTPLASNAPPGGSARSGHATSTSAAGVISPALRSTSVTDPNAALVEDTWPSERSSARQRPSVSSVTSAHFLAPIIEAAAEDGGGTSAARGDTVAGSELSLRSKSHGEGGVTSGPQAAAASPLGRRIPLIRSLPTRQPPSVMPPSHVVVDVDGPPSAGLGGAAASSRVIVDLDDDVGVGRANAMPPRNILETACLPPENDEAGVHRPVRASSPATGPPGRATNVPGAALQPASTSDHLEGTAASCSGALRRRAVTVVVLLAVLLAMCVALVIAGFVLASLRHP